METKPVYQTFVHSVDTDSLKYIRVKFIKFGILFDSDSTKFMDDMAV